MSKDNPSSIQFDCQFDPPTAPVGGDYSTVSCAFTLNAVRCTSLAKQPCHVRGIHVGIPAESFREQLVQAELEDLEFLDTSDGSSDETEILGASTVCHAVKLLEKWHLDHQDAPCHALIFVHHQTVENTQELGEVIEGSDRSQLRCDIFGAGQDLDLRLLNQAAMLLGGFFGAPGHDGVDADLLQFRSRSLLDQRIQGLEISIQWVPSVLPVHVFSVCEQPHFLRDLGSESTPYVHRFFAGPIGPKTPPTTFVFKSLIQRRRSGEYRVATVKIAGRVDGSSWAQSFDLVQPASGLPSETDRANSAVGALADRLQPALWWEEVCQAFTREDGNQIVRTFESLICHEFEHRRHETVDQLRRMRMEFIRGGYFGLDALGKLWALTHRRTPCQ